MKDLIVAVGVSVLAVCLFGCGAATASKAGGESASSHAGPAQAARAPSNPLQERCIESAGQDPFGSIQVVPEGDSFRVPSAEIKKALGVYGRQVKHLREGAEAGHLPSLYLLANSYHGDDVRSVSGLPTAEESSAAFHKLYDNHFPLAAAKLAGECWEALPDIPEKWSPFTNSNSMGIAINVSSPNGCPSARYFEAHPLARVWCFPGIAPAEMVKWLAEVAMKREACLNLYREGGFRGDTRAWEKLAEYDNSNPPPVQVGIVPPVEHYAWLELDKLAWRERPGWEDDEYNVPKMQQDDLVKFGFLNEEQQREALALAKKYTEIVWPRRIRDGTDVCRLIPQFAGDRDPYESDLFPR
jgi:hypothetical protein